MLKEKDMGVATLIMLNILMLTMSSFEMQLISFLFQSVFIAFYCFTCMSYFYTILTKQSSNLIPMIIFMVMGINLVLIPPTSYFILILATIIIGITTLLFKVYKKRKTTISRKDEIDKELNDDWKEEPHLLFEESDIGKMV